MRCESEAKVEPTSTNKIPTCLSPLLTLTMKHKAGTLHCRAGHVLCLGHGVAEGGDLAGAGGAR
jgi:hypothetical protein